MRGSLKILMLAPQPFFRPRGTPLSVLHRIRALLALGHRVELLTYPFGEDPELPGLTVTRSRRPPLIRAVGIGPSLAKLVLDVPLFAEARRMVRTGSYDLLYTHEEAGAMGALLSRSYGIPHVYDMHSSLPAQFAAFGRFNFRPIVSFFEWMERISVANAAGILTVFPDLRDHVKALGYTGPLVLLENTLDFPVEEPETGAVEALRQRLGLVGRQTLMYTGTLEAYQGMDLLLDACALAYRKRPTIKLVSVGGTPEQARALGMRAASLGLEDMAVFVPAVPPQGVPNFHRVSDALITTRTRGTNTPLKLYQYLRSGKPVIATDIHSHTQVLNRDVAELVPPTTEGVASGIERVLGDADYAASLARCASALALEEYSEEAYMEGLRSFLEDVGERIPDRTAASP